MKILIIGATSAIATACARLWAKEEAEFFLVGRHAERLQQTADDLTARGAKGVEILAADPSDLSSHAATVESSFNKLGTIDIVLIAHGSLPDQKACQNDVNLALEEFQVNGLSVISLLSLLGNRMESQGSGTLAVISSVAGDRGRPSNYLYGTAKAAVTTFCDGLRARLHKRGVRILTIKPGFVDTPMTQGLPLPRLLVATPEKVAMEITDAIKRGKDVLYTPWFWRYIMLLIIHMPTRIFKKISL